MSYWVSIEEVFPILQNLFQNIGFQSTQTHLVNHHIEVTMWDSLTLNVTLSQSYHLYDPKKPESKWWANRDSNSWFTKLNDYPAWIIHKRRFDFRTRHESMNLLYVCNIELISFLLPALVLVVGVVDLVLSKNSPENCIMMAKTLKGPLY